MASYLLFIKSSPSFLYLPFLCAYKVTSIFLSKVTSLSQSSYGFVYELITIKGWSVLSCLEVTIVHSPVLLVTNPKYFVSFSPSPFAPRAVVLEASHRAPPGSASPHDSPCSGATMMVPKLNLSKLDLGNTPIP